MPHGPTIIRLIISGLCIWLLAGYASAAATPLSGATAAPPAGERVQITTDPAASTSAADAAIDVEAPAPSTPALDVAPPVDTATLAPSAAVAPAPASEPQARGGGPANAIAPTVPEPRVTGAAPPTTMAPAPPAPTGLVQGITTDAYVIVNGATGEVLGERLSYDRRAPASLTKVMTALLTLERAPDLEAVAIVPEAVAALRFSTLMGITPGERVTVRNLLYGLMLPSGNDAAIALATHVSGNEPAFVALMNQRARELSLWDTHFANSHGLDSRNGDHYTSAHDLAALTRFAFQQPFFRTLASTRVWRGGGYSMVNFNSLLNTYPGADGVKIGYTRRAQHTIIASAHRGGAHVIAVVLNSTQLNTDATKLLDYGFKQLAQ